ncbi:MAG TPA: SPOR domain-containing protein [Bacteroidia bacterium]|nr:SPOR domain-containing protein [Bacteroidia bacterium]
MKHFTSILLLLFIANITKAQITVQTNIPASIAPSSEHKVEVKVSKGGISGFAKYQMDLPAGMSAGEGKSIQGSFTFEEQRVKIVWVNIPSENEFVFSFVLNTGSVKGPVTLNQKFFYLEEGGKKEMEPEPLSIKVEENGATNLASLGLSDNAGTSGGVVQNNNSTKSNDSDKKEISSKEDTKPVIETPVAAGALVYKLQLGAFGADPGKSKFASAGNVSIVKEDGLFKVLVGSYTSKEEALKKREDLLGKGISSFLAAYKDGKRQK